MNPTTGAVSGFQYFWQDDYPAAAGVTGIGNLYMAEQWPDSSAGKNAINICLNAVSPNILIHCDEFMLPVCGDTDENMVFDPTGKYLLFNDFAISEMPNSLPQRSNHQRGSIGRFHSRNANTITFSPTGLLLYGLESGEVLVYVFNRHNSGLNYFSALSPGLGFVE